MAATGQCVRANRQFEGFESPDHAIPADGIKAKSHPHMPLLPRGGSYWLGLGAELLARSSIATMVRFSCVMVVVEGASVRTFVTEAPP